MTWQAGVALGGALAMSSTAMVMRLAADRGELESAHGRPVVGVLLFQDLAVVPLLVLIPALSGLTGQSDQGLGWALSMAIAKSLLVLGLALLIGQRLVRPWLALVARRKSQELFTLNVLLMTLGLALITEHAGLSLALGAFFWHQHRPLIKDWPVALSGRRVWIRALGSSGPEWPRSPIGFAASAGRDGDFDVDCAFHH